MSASSITPNMFAYMALFGWPVFAAYLYSTQTIARATIWTILGGFLLLPVGTSFKIEMIPEFNKYSISSLAALAGCVLATRQMPKIWHSVGLPELLIAMYLLGPFMTSSLNGDTIVIATRVLQAETLYDGLSAAIAQFMVLIPFFVGRQFLRSAISTAEVLRILVVSGLAYSLLILFEIRMSPQLHTWLYGYFPTDWIQQLRNGGFRAVVFLGHGLQVALFAMMAAVASAALSRTQFRVFRVPPIAVTGYLSAVLVLCQTLGSILYAAVAIPLIRWTRPTVQAKIAVVLVVSALSYPLLRTMDWVPTSTLLSLAGSVSEQREASLKVRFDNEQLLLTRASERLWFGWGRWGRNRVYRPENGDDATITDGGWIIVLGTFGLVGFVAQFGLLAWSVFRAAAALKLSNSKSDTIYLAAAMLMLTMNVIDLVPNSALTPWTWLMAGMLLGRAEALSAVRNRQQVALVDRNKNIAYSPEGLPRGSRSIAVRSRGMR